MALAGIVAKKGAFGHWLDGGYAGDMRTWGRATSVAGEDLGAIREQLERLLGCSLVDVMRRTEAWVVDSYERIAKVATALAGGASSGTLSRVDYAAGPRQISSEEAAAAANS